MKIFFDRIITGSPVDFVWNSGEILFGADSGECDWRFCTSGKKYRCVRSASEAAGCDLLVLPNEPQVSFWKKHTQHPAWHKIVSKASFVSHIENQVSSVVQFVERESNQYYLNQFQIQQRLIDSLYPCKIRNHDLVEFGFKPDEFGFARIPVYDNVHSSTGRMTIVDGPKILTLQKELRKNIISRWEDGVLVEVDFNALDARVLGWISGHPPAEGDMYEWIGNQSGTKDAPRHVVKEATLAAMYGMSKRNFALRFQDFPDAIDVYEKVRSMMKVKDLEQKLAEQAQLRNAFGRKLSDSSAKISHHVQSSAVDVACSGFDWLVQQIDTSVCLPIFLIHDAMVLDVKRSYLSELDTLCKSGLFVPMIDQSFPVKIRSF